MSPALTITSKWKSFINVVYLQKHLIYFKCFLTFQYLSAINAVSSVGDWYVGGVMSHFSDLPFFGRELSKTLHCIV